MKLSVVVSTLNDREQLLPCLDALEAHVPAETEIIVVNGPSSDGTTGAVMEREDVDVLVEISERNRNVSRNAGIETASGDVVAFLGDEYAVEPSWYDAISVAMASDADIVTGPVVGGSPGTRRPNVDPTDSKTVAGRAITPFDGDNVAFDRSVLEALDGFDEYLCAGGARDCAHRVAGMSFDVTWSGEMTARYEVETDGGQPDTDWADTYRSLGYRLAKNYGLRPSVVGRTAGSAVRDGYEGARAVATGEGTPTGWFGNGTDVFANALGGWKDGVRARFDDRSSRRNPNGISTRHDRAVQVYDRRDE